jgi:tetratricopeptide (TPR) repeat protein
MGYELFRKDNIPQSLETFKIGYFLYPEHPFLCQLYADVLGKAGKKEEAIWMYNKALWLNPDNKEAAKGLREISE